MIVSCCILHGSVLLRIWSLLNVTWIGLCLLGLAKRTFQFIICNHQGEIVPDSIMDWRDIGPCFIYLVYLLIFYFTVLFCIINDKNYPVYNGYKLYFYFIYFSHHLIVDFYTILFIWRNFVNMYRKYSFYRELNFLLKNTWSLCTSNEYRQKQETEVAYQFN